MKHRFILSGVLCLSFMLLPACAPQPEQQAEPVAQETPNPEADEAAIKSVNEQCLAALNGGDVDAIVNFILDDAVFMPPNAAALVGKAAIQSWLQTATDTYTFDETWSSEEIVVFGDWAFDRGTSKVLMTSKAGGEPVDVTGKYIWIYERQADGNWKYARCIWNNDNPPPGEPTT